MFKNNRSLLVIALVAIVNALGYGIIIPILYSYSRRYGLSDFQNGLLFSIFSLCQFLSTPIIGRLSDKYGRKPLLVISLSGTVLSFVTMAFAPSAIFLFLARAIDGITAGNVPVAMAVISDTTKPEERARGFGIVGAAFGFGFVAGPAISAITVGINPQVPFLVAAFITMVAITLTLVLLPETNKNIGEVKSAKLFDFPRLIKAVTDENLGHTLLITLFFSLAFGLLIYAYQPFAVKILGLEATQISLNFTLFGIVGLFAQGFLVPRVLKWVQDKKLLINALLLCAFSFLGVFLAKNYLLFVVSSVFVSLSNSFVQPLTQSLLSKETDEKSQGEIMGINSSYMSIGTIFGPIIGGLMAGVSVSFPFLGGSVFCLVCVFLAYKILVKPGKLISLEG